MYVLKCVKLRSLFSCFSPNKWGKSTYRWFWQLFDQVIVSYDFFNWWILLQLWDSNINEVKKEQANAHSELSYLAFLQLRIRSCFVSFLSSTSILFKASKPWFCFRLPDQSLATNSFFCYKAARRFTCRTTRISSRFFCVWIQQLFLKPCEPCQQLKRLR